mmetsp:Transcript_7445/g.18536  ORF Transcript_7445/g.18536 Transcript_7445/m.18536 type:complete len:234 (+) Transcript_7445:1157-1858(+)
MHVELARLLLDVRVLLVTPWLVGLAVGQEEEDLVTARAGAARVTRAEDLPRLGEGRVEVGRARCAHAFDPSLDLIQVGLRRLHEAGAPPRRRVGDRVACEVDDRDVVGVGERVDHLLGRGDGHVDAAAAHRAARVDHDDHVLGAGRRARVPRPEARVVGPEAPLQPRPLGVRADRLRAVVLVAEARHVRLLGRDLREAVGDDARQADVLLGGGGVRVGAVAKTYRDLLRVDFL